MTDDQLAFQGLTHSPFETNPESGHDIPPYAFATLAGEIISQINTGHPVIGVRGAPGVGKTAFAHALAARLDPSQSRSIQVSSASAAPRTLQRLLGEAAGLHDDKPDPARLLKALQAEYHARRLILIVDGADLLPPASFHYLWQLVELCRLKAIRLHIVLVGDLGAWPGLNAPGLTEMRRASISSHMIPGLTDDEAAAYLDRKLRQAGRSLSDLMPRRAMAVLIEHAGGIPARLKACTEAALAHACNLRARRITLPILCEALSIAPPHTPVLERLEPFASVPVLAAAAAVIAIASVAALARGPAAPPQRQTVAGLSEPAMPQPATRPLHLREERPPPQPSLATYSRPDDALPIPRETAPPPPAHDANTAKPHGQGLVLIASAGDNMANLYKRVYRGLQPPPYREVIAVNREPIRQGSLVVFPEPPHGWSAQ